MIYLSAALFGAGSLVAALAGNFTVLIAGRTIQGVGGGGLIALTEVGRAQDLDAVCVFRGSSPC